MLELPAGLGREIYRIYWRGQQALEPACTSGCRVDRRTFLVYSMVVLGAGPREESDPDICQFAWARVLGLDKAVQIPFKGSDVPRFVCVREVRFR
jgi:hypothetical protein